MSPFTEFLGALGDEVRRFRIHREQVALATLKRAKEIRNEEGISAKPVSQKLLAPWLEGASLEGEDDENISELWARLLAHAPEDFSSEYAAIVDILKKIGKREASALEEYAIHKDFSGSQDFIGAMDGVYKEYVELHFEAIARNFESEDSDADELRSAIFEQFNAQEDGRGGYPVRACSLFAGRRGDDGSERMIFLNSDFAHKHKPALEILDHNRLLALRQIYFSDEELNIGGHIVLYELTSLGKRLLQIIYS